MCSLSKPFCNAAITCMLDVYLTLLNEGQVGRLLCPVQLSLVCVSCVSGMCKCIVLDCVMTEMQCNCAMGVFAEIRRAWLTIDSNIYMWNYVDGWVWCGVV